MATAQRWSRGVSIVVLCVALVSLSACASTRYIASPSSPPPDPGIAGSNEDLSIALNYLITPNGPGSWVKEARWDEYVGIVRNLSKEPLTVEKVRLIDPRGVYIESDVNPWQLEKASEQLAGAYRDVGILVAIHAVPAAVTGAALGAGSLAGAAAASVVLMPVAVVAGPAYLAMQASQHYANTKDREDIEREFKRRQLTTFTLAGNATITGSVFFPIVPNPRSLVLDYRMGTQTKQLEVSLEKLAGLHVAPAPQGEKELSEEKK